jgi:hypothetical protein
VQSICTESGRHKTGWFPLTRVMQKFQPAAIRARVGFGPLSGIAPDLICGLSTVVERNDMAPSSSCSSELHVILTSADPSGKRRPNATRATFQRQLGEPYRREPGSKARGW